MTEKPILFNTEMVKAILDGRKTQTRRPVNGNWVNAVSPESLIPMCTGQAPYGQAGNVILAKEDAKGGCEFYIKIKSVRIERLQDMHDSDAYKEGINRLNEIKTLLWYDGSTPVERFSKLWDSIYAKRGYAWNENPWVWVYEFERVEK